MTKRISTILAALVAASVIALWLSRNKESSPTCTTIDTIIVGTNADFAPFTFIENDEIVGFDIDIMREIVKRLGKKMILSNMSFSALIPELQLGTIHTIAAGIAPSPERAKRAFFTTPHFSGDQLMAIQKAGATPITSNEQLQQAAVAVNQGYIADNYLTDIGAQNIIRLSSPLISMGLLAVNSGQADVYVAAYSTLKPFLAKQKESYTINSIEGTADSSAIAVSKKYPDLFASIEKIVLQMINDGTIQQFKKKWNIND